MGYTKMNMLHRSRYTRSHPIRVRGIALIEALIALAIMVGGVAAIFGVHGYVVGASAESRLQTAAMSLAQQKSEEFRTMEFADLEAGNETAQIRIPGIGRSSNINLRVCWDFVDTGVAGLVEDSLVQVNLSVVRDGETCTPGGAGIASLSTLLAQQDPRVAARNTRDQMLRDGEGQLLDALPDSIKDDPDLASGPGPGGFQFYRDEDGLIAAVVNPETGQAMVPRDGEQLKVASIHGNLILRGDYSDVRGLRVGAPGVAFCRVQYPGSASVVFPNEGDGTASRPSTPVLATSGLDPVTYVQYTCIVANGWRRSIFPVFPEAGDLERGTMRVCTGNPRLQPNPVTGDADLLVWPGREYVGYTGTIDNSGDFPVITNREPHGVRGAADGKSAVIGSLCVDGQDCWDDANLRGWIPGGHHFFIDKKDTSPAFCSQSMGILAEIDESSATPKTLIRNILFRNPEKVYCTSEKRYTTALIQRLLADEDIPSTDCLSYTRVSGFFARDESVQGDSLDGNQIFINAASRFDRGCAVMGEFGAPGSGREANGAYVCGFGESTVGLNLGASIPSTPFTFDAGYDDEWMPYVPENIVVGDVPLDIAWMNFLVDVIEPELTVTAAMTSVGTDYVVIDISGTSIGLGANFVLGFQITDGAGNDRRKDLEAEILADVGSGGAYSTSAMVVSGEPSLLTVTATAPDVKRDGGDLVASTTVDIAGGVTPPPPPPPLSCAGFTVTTGTYNGSQREVDGITYPSGTGQCDESGSGNNTFATCVVPDGVTVTPGMQLLIQYSAQSRGNMVSQPPRVVTVAEADIATGGCQRTGVAIP